MNKVKEISSFQKIISWVMRPTLNIVCMSGRTLIFLEVIKHIKLPVGIFIASPTFESHMPDMVGMDENALQ